MNWILSMALLLATSRTFAGQAGFDATKVRTNGLSKEQAKQVLLLVLKDEKYKLSMLGVFIDDDLSDKNGNPPHPGYYDFSVGYDSPSAGATDYMGLFSVSVMTGDVWDINICKHFSFRELKIAQAAIMHRTGKTFASEAARREGLGCPDK